MLGLIALAIGASLGPTSVFAVVNNWKVVRVMCGAVIYDKLPQMEDARESYPKEV